MKYSTLLKIVLRSKIVHRLDLLYLRYSLYQIGPYSIKILYKNKLCHLTSYKLSCVEMDLCVFYYNVLTIYTPTI